MAWKQEITYDIMQDVQYYNDIEITSHTVNGERYYRAYSLFDAAAPDSINKSIRSAMISRIGHMAAEHGGAVLMRRFKFANAWFLSSRLLRIAADTVNPVDASDNRRRKSGDWHDYEISDLMAALKLAEKLDALPADGTSWPVAMVQDLSGAPGDDEAGKSDAEI